MLIKRATWLETIHVLVHRIKWGLSHQPVYMKYNMKFWDMVDALWKRTTHITPAHYRYADLGVRHISGSATSSLNVSHDSLQVGQFMGDERRPSQTQGLPPQAAQPPRSQPSPRGQPQGYPAGPPAGYGNQGYQPSPSHAAPYHPPPGSDTVV